MEFFRFPLKCMHTISDIKIFSKKVKVKLKRFDIGIVRNLRNFSNEPKRTFLLKTRASGIHFA